jgi:hypothetical protein
VLVWPSSSRSPRSLVHQETGEVLDRDLVGGLDLLERDPEGRLVVVDL